MTVLDDKTEEQESSNFVSDIVEADLAAKTHDGRVATRFPPEPNGYLHIGHAKSICLNFGIAETYGGTCNLRFDDTNPTTEDEEFVQAIEQDVRWLGFDWGDREYFASQYFERLYELAVGLVERELAYVDSLDGAQIREYRGTILEPGRPSPYRDRSVAENLDLFRRMRAGEFHDGEHVLRARIDLAANNMLMRDPVLYRIRHARHHRTGLDWPIYPMYDYTHCLSDSFEGVTHSLCTLEFENNRALYDWVLEATEVPCRPRQYEFARMNLSYTVLSKRKLLQLVEEKHVDGWDDPRMPTLSGLRRRGYPARAIRDFCDRIGVAKTQNTIDLALLEFSVRNVLNTEVPRVLGVLKPLKVIIDNYPEAESEMLEAPYYPRDVPKDGSRALPFSRELLIEESDFQEQPAKGFFRLAPGQRVRLRYAYIITCERVVKDQASGKIVALHCTYDPATRGGHAPAGTKVKGTIHWVSARHGIRAEVRLYDRLFLHERPDSTEAGGDFISHLNPDSLERLRNCVLEPSLAGAAAGERFQLERLGYFCVDPVDSRSDNLVLNRTVGLRDTWAKVSAQNQESPAPSKARPATAAGSQEPVSDSGADLLGAEKLCFERFVNEDGLEPRAARALVKETSLSRLFREALEVHDDPKAIANIIVNELLAARKERPVGQLPISGAQLGNLTALLAAGKISGTSAKEILAEVLDTGSDPIEIVERRGLQLVDDEAAIELLVSEVMNGHADKAEMYRRGKVALMGFFIGEVMRASRGRARPDIVRRILEQRLAG